MSLEIANLVLHTIETVGILSLIFAIFEIRRGNNQRFREVLANYLQLMRENFRRRFEKEGDTMAFKTTLLTLDQCMFSVLNQTNKIKMKELTDELSRVSTTLYFGELEEVKQKLEWFKTELFR